jgi:hypothetical protein
VGSIGTDEGTLYIGRNDTGVIFEGFAADSLVPYNPSTNTIRDNAINLGYASSSFKDLYLSGGVYLGGTGSANYLDDYETGTWTPTVGEGWSSVSYALRVGTYTKIGNQVTAWFFLRFTGTNGAEDVGITGLPFTATNGHGGSITYYDAPLNETQGVLLYTPTDTKIVFYSNSDSGALIESNGNASNDYLIGFVTYQTSA